MQLWARYLVLSFYNGQDEALDSATTFLYFNVHQIFYFPFVMGNILSVKFCTYHYALATLK